MLIPLSSPSAKNIYLPFFGNAWFASEGRFAIVTDVECGMRWTRRCRKTSDADPLSPKLWRTVPGLSRVLGEGVRVRQSRVVLATRRWCQVARNLFSRGDGGKKARSPGRARNKPVKPLRREGWVAPTIPVVPSPCFFTHGGRGCGGHPAFPAPSSIARAVMQ
jgi:hypothetical protein